MVNVAFIRKNNKKVKRGFVADLPFGVNVPLPYVDPFIIVQIDESTIPQDALGNPTVQLKLNKLQKVDTFVKYTDEDGKKKNRTEYDYYSKQGHSSKPFPVITMEDVTYDNMG